MPGAQTKETFIKTTISIVAEDNPFKKVWDNVDDVIAEPSKHKPQKGKTNKKTEDEWITRTRAELNQYLGRACIIDNGGTR